MVKQGVASGLLTLIVLHCLSFTLMSSLGYLDQLSMPKDLQLHFFPKSVLASAVHGAVFKVQLGDKGELGF